MDLNNQLYQWHLQEKKKVSKKNDHKHTVFQSARQVINQFLLPSYKRVVITNAKHNSLNFYSLYIAKDTVEFAKKSNGKVNRLVIDLEKQVISQNKDALGEDFIGVFQRLLEKVGSDIEAGKADIFTEGEAL